MCGVRGKIVCVIERESRASKTKEGQKSHAWHGPYDQGTIRGHDGIGKVVPFFDFYESSGRCLDQVESQKRGIIKKVDLKSGLSRAPFNSITLTKDILHLAAAHHSWSSPFYLNRPLKHPLALYYFQQQNA